MKSGKNSKKRNSYRAGPAHPSRVDQHTNTRDANMHKKWSIAIALAAALVMPVLAHAHEGHVHKIMGTVSMRNDNHLEVKATDGKTSAITLNENTKILRGRTKGTAEDIKPGERIVVTATETKGKDGRMAMIATEVRLPAEAPAK